MKKNILLISFMLILVLFLYSCADTTTGEVGGGDVPSDPKTEVLPNEDKIEIIKNYESLTISEGKSKEYDLNNYISYNGTKYSFICVTQDKGIVSANVSGTKLTITAVSPGTENVVVSLNGNKITFMVTVNEVTVKTDPIFDDVSIEYSLDEHDSYEYEITPTNSGDYSLFTYFLKEESNYVNLTDNKLTISVKKALSFTFIVVVSYGDNLSLEFDVNVTATSNRVVDVVNGSFDNGLEGWTLEGEFGVITDKATWWSEGMPMFNVGNYFSGYDSEGNSYESLTGTLTSSSFILDGNGYITFMLGGSGNPNCYISVIDSEGNVLAIYRNTQFSNFPDGFVLGENIEEGKVMVGDTVFLANFVKYKADLSEHIGKELRVVVNDNATSGWGLVFFDELVTFNDKDLEGFVLATNELSDFSNVKELIENEILELGDYTSLSYEEYKEKVLYVKETIKDVSIKQEVVDSLYQELLAAINNLEYREIEIIVEAPSKTSIVSGYVNLELSDYFDTKELSNITFDVVCDKEYILNDSVLIISNVGTDVTTFTLSVDALYKGEVQKSLVITIEVIADPTPIVKEDVVTKKIDLYENNDGQIDLSSNINNVANLELEYWINSDGDWTKLNTSLYCVNELGSKTTSVKVKYLFNGETFEVGYTLNLTVKDSTSYQLINGDFETGDLTGWTLSGPMGDVSDKTNYWLNDPEVAEGYEFGLDGKYMFSAYAVDKEYAYGTLKSSAFVVGGTGWITFKIGAAKNTSVVNIQVIDKATGDILMAFGNTEWADRTNGLKSGCSLIAYKADLSSLLGKEVYIRIVDNAKDDYGLFFLDSFYTYYEEEPSNEFITAAKLEITGNIYEVVNGGFEQGLYGWNVYEGELPGKVSNLNGYWRDEFLFEKDGEYLFHALEGQDFNTDPSLEYRTGVMRSFVFTLKENAIISFKLGAAKNNTTGIRFINASTGEVIGDFYNTEFLKHDGNEGRLMQYVYQFANETEVECYIEIYDYSTSDWGLVAVDSIMCNIPSKDLENSFEAINQIN